MTARATRAAACALALGLAVGAVACGRNDGSDDAGTTKPREISQVCPVTAVFREHPGRITTFSQLITRPATDDDLIGGAAGIVLLRSRYDADLGPYEPVIDHLVDVYRAIDGGTRPAPTVTAEVRRSAERLDRDLADGLCT